MTGEQRTPLGGAPSDAGFTLLEVLVSMTLLAMLSVALLSAIHFGTEIWHASERAASDSNRIRSVQAELSQAIARAYPETVADASDGHVDFDGQADSLTFLVPDENVPGALSRIAIAVDDDDKAANLTMSQVLELAASPDDDDTRRVLLRGVKSIDIAYFGKRGDKAVAEWDDSWRNRNTLPQLIRIRIAFADAHARPWPDLIVAPHIAADVNCTYDPITKSCQGI
jgi:general secretion pathway protein J